MKKIIFLILIIILSLSFLCFSSCASSNDLKTNPDTLTVLKADESPDGYATVIKPERRDLKILQLTDTQLDPGLSRAYIGADNDKTMLLIEKLVKKIAPDLVIITGDMTISKLYNNWPWMKKYCDLFEDLNTFWAPVYGNHDSQYNRLQQVDDLNAEIMQISKELLTDKLSDYKHCLITAGDAEEGGGCGNYFINIKNSEGDYLYTLSIFDTVYNGKQEYKNDDYYKREKTPQQIEWYKKHINNISDLAYGGERTSDQVIKSLVFTHVPVPETALAYNAYNNYEEEAVYHYGDMLEGTDYDELSCNFFREAKALGSTTAMFFGHHHDNDYSVTYQGIRLTFGQHSGFSHYYRIDEGSGIIKTADFTKLITYKDNRGGTLITLSGNAIEKMDFTVSQMLARVIFEDYTSWSIDYESLEYYQKWLAKQD